MMPLAFPNPARRLFRTFPFFALLAAGAAEVLFLGCASPGAPVTRNTQKPQAITDLSAARSGNSVVLSFTLPTKTARGQNLAGAPAVEIYREFESAPQGTLERKGKPRLLVTIPPQMVPRYSKAGRVIFPDVLTPQDFSEHRGAEVVYEVRTRIGRSSSDSSNSVRMPILSVPQPIRDLRAQIVDRAIELAWSAPETSPAASVQAALTYNVYRAEVSSGSSARPSETHIPAVRSGATPDENFKLLGESSQPSYTDPSVESGRTYAYMVRSAAKYPAGAVESQDSNRAQVTFTVASQPAVPEHLVATITPANQENSSAVELSWSISQETGLAGYNVYRSDTESITGTRVNSTPILVPVFRDSSVAQGQEYFYRVTAVSRAGTESGPSASVRVTVPKQP